MLVARVPRLADLALILEQANVKWSVQSFLVLSLGLGIGVGLATLIITRWLPAAILATAAATMVPFLHVRSKRARRLRAFEEHLPEAIDLMARALRAGHPFSAGMSMVADEIPDPVGIEFRRLFEQQRFGLSTTDALLALADRVPLTDVRILVTAVVVQREVGGNLAELLDNISYTIRERFKIRRQIRVHTAQGRLTGYILAAMPVITGFAFFVINPDYIMVLFKTAAGHFVLGTVLVLQVIGFIWIRRVINIEF
jgi:tight adherence protein B